MSASAAESLANPASTADSLIAKTVPAWRDLLFLAILTLGIWSVTCGLWVIHGPDEARYTIIARELLQHHNWLHLTLLGEPYDEKPPLAFWMFSAMLWLSNGEINTAFLRQPSAIGATIVVLLVYLIGRKHWSRRAGLMAALMIATTAAFVDDAPTVELNMLYTFWITVALYAWINRPASGPMPLGRVLLFWLGVNGAFFVKGPLAFFIILSAMMWEAAAARDWRRLRLVKPLVGIIATVALIAGWFYAEKSAFGEGFVSAQVTEQTYTRLLHGSHSAPFWFYFPRIFTNIAPFWAFLLIPAAVVAWWNRRDLQYPVTTVLGWMIPPFVLLVIANGKRNSYMTPLLPALALFLAWFVERALAGKPAPRWLRLLIGVLAFVFCAALVGGAAKLNASPDHFVPMGFRFLQINAVLWAAAGVFLFVVGIIAFRKIRLWEHAVYCLGAILLTAVFLNITTINPGLEHRYTARPLADYLHTLLGNRNENTIGALGSTDEPEYHVYGNWKVQRIHKSFDPTDKGLPNVLIVSESATKNRNDALRLAGYDTLTTLSVSEETITVYVRPKNRVM